ncbi:MAG TPA: ribosome small subunit-dependent GTPase A [Steroidobacteraceae bacterium]|jgi:ribosome biogenesis GTPase
MSVARVTVTHRRLLHVRSDDGREAVARPARRGLSIVCGDFVRCELDPRHGELNVVGVEPRASALYRTNARGGSELIAANLSLLLAVVAPLPRPDFFVIDRYLCAARCGGLAAAVVLNKSELPMEAGIEQELATYGAAGYRCLRISAHQQEPLDALLAWLPQQTAMLVGQSGVGKSSLLRRLVPESEAPIGELIRDDDGRHTTTATRLYQLPGGGEIIDSPGVRDFAPAIDRLERSDLGFAEIERLAPQCRFADCGHMHEPDCAVRAAVGGAMSARRYESYRRLRRLYERLSAQRLAASDRRRR